MAKLGLKHLIKIKLTHRSIKDVLCKLYKTFSGKARVAESGLKRLVEGQVDISQCHAGSNVN